MANFALKFNDSFRRGNELPLDFNCELEIKYLLFPE